MKVSFRTTTSTAKAATCGAMAENTKDNGGTIARMAKDYSHGVTVEVTKANTATTKKKELEPSNGQMGVSTKAIGKMANSMVLALILPLEERSETVNGKKVAEHAGL